MLRTTIKWTMVFMFMFFHCNVSAADYWLRPSSGEYGAEDGSDYDNAYDGILDIPGADWAAMGANDTLWVCGNTAEDPNHTTNFHMSGNASGTAAGDFTVRCDCSTSNATYIDGVLYESMIRYTDATLEYVTFYRVRQDGRTFGGYWGQADSGYNDVDPDGTNGWFDCAGCDFVADGFSAGMKLYVEGSGSAHGRGFLISAVAATRLTIDETGSNRDVVEEGVTSYRFMGHWPMKNITFDQCKFYNDSEGLGSGSVLSLPHWENVTIKDSEFDGNYADLGGAIYLSNHTLYTQATGVLIEGNYIHRIGEAAQAGGNDAHGIGLQCGNGVIIRDNYFEDAGSGVVAWASEGYWPIVDLQIYRNKFYHMNKERQPSDATWGGSAIVLTGDDDCTGSNADIYNNVLGDPLNCDQGSTSECLGIRSKWEGNTKIYHNTVVGFDYNYKIDDAGGNPDAYLQNNISVNPSLYHVYGPGDSGYDTWVEDNNVYYPDTGTKFYWSGEGALNFTNYNAAVPETINANSSTSDPLLQGDYTLATGSSAIDLGADLGETYDDGLLPGTVWPFGPGTADILTGDRDDWGRDAGAYIFSPLDSLIITGGGSATIDILPGGNDFYTELLLHCEGDDESTTFTDSSGSAHTPTANDNAQIDTAQWKFGNASGLLDGTGDYVSVADHADWNMGSGAATIDCWVHPHLDLRYDPYGIWGQYVDSDNYVALWRHSDAYVYFRIVVSGVTQVELSAYWAGGYGQWRHWAVIRGWGGNPNSWALCRDGTAVDTTTDSDSWPDLAATFDVGRANAVYHYGWIDEVRVSKGVARWTANFTPPVVAYGVGNID